MTEEIINCDFYNDKICNLFTEYFKFKVECKNLSLCTIEDDAERECPYKQLKRLEQENKEQKEYIKDLQVRKDKYYLQVLEYERQVNDWISFYIKVRDIVAGNYEMLESQGLQDLRRIINEVEE